MSDCDSKLELARFKVYQEYAPRFYIAFKDKDELYQLFKKKIGELGIEPANIYFTNYYGEIVEINDAESLLEIVRDQLRVNSHTVRISVCDNNDKVVSFSAHDKRFHRHARRTRQERTNGCECCRNEDHHNLSEPFPPGRHFRYDHLPSPLHYNHNCIDPSRFGPFHVDFQSGRYPFHPMGACCGRH
ncbi:hypothetical protein KIN20_014040 [Parelaphostrongylus tenuis]|uniref:Uncharacterized protein n=1 Tax=Parelaphostrongylus tenuis TaxID=148309 RepID=A0AAD5MD08_PARTN|nr:hypothetical protein KIN20_014011 [Parelaphostrongylus tenuis]KAJ1356340.1 hypothetical protein KIN20_014040 [Parelaphostrongylus tenuis]